MAHALLLALGIQQPADTTDWDTWIMTGTREGEPRPTPAVGQMTTSELRQRRKEIEHALKDKDIGHAPIAADLRASLTAIVTEQDTRAAAEAASREQERALRLKREGRGPTGVHPDVLLRVGQGG